MPGWLTLMGSGETAAGMTRVHRALLQGMAEPARAVFLETPAGFELGADAIAARFREYAERNLGLPFSTAPFRRPDDEPALHAAALAAVAAGNYLLAGPGSPTYAVRAWRGSPFFAAVVERWKSGAQLIFASAAAIALGRHTLPVYEIYKVGEKLHWIDGLDLLGPFGFDLAIITHWDNAEGGTHDTRACFMGMERFDRLRCLLPASTVVLGVDEHTACTLNLDAGRAKVRGRGGVTILHGEEILRHGDSEGFDLTELISPAEVGAKHPAPQSFVAESLGRGASPPRTSTDSRLSPGALARAASLIAQGDLAAGLVLASEGADPGLAALLHQAAQAAKAGPADEPIPEGLIDLLLQARSALREAKEWALADQLRDGLDELGIEVQDTPQGTVWTKREAGLTRP